MSTRSPSGTSSPGHGVDRLQHRRALPGQGRFLDLQRRGDEQPAVRRDLVARLERDDVTRARAPRPARRRARRPRRACAWIRSIFWSAATLSAAFPSWFRPRTAFSTVMPMITRPVENSCRATMLTSAAPRSTSCIRSRYWRRNACQPGSFSASASLFGPCSARRPLDLGRVEPRHRVDPELGARLVRRHAVPGDLRVPYVDGGGAHSASTPVIGPIITGTAGARLAPTAAPLREAAKSRRRTLPARAPSLPRGPTGSRHRLRGG